MTEYVRKTFEHASQALRFMEDGGDIYKFEFGAYRKMCMDSVYNHQRSGMDMYTIKPTDWREQLDGADDSGVLCWCNNRSGARVIVIIVGIFNESDNSFLCNNGSIWKDPSLLTQSEIDKFKENAPV